MVPTCKKCGKEMIKLSHCSRYYCICQTYDEWLKRNEDYRGGALT